MSSEQKPAPDQLEVAPGFEHDRLEGWVPQLANEEDLCAALEKGFDYRGDVTITRKDGSTLTGYVFDVIYRFKKVGSNTWSDWKVLESGVPQASADFAPARGVSTYSVEGSTIAIRFSSGTLAFLRAKRAAAKSWTERTAFVFSVPEPTRR